MKSYIYLISFVFICSCNNKHKGKYEEVIRSKFDTIGIDSYSADSGRMIVYTAVHQEFNSNVFILNNNTQTIGRLKNQNFDGRFYVFDSDNIIENVMYYINNQLICSYNTHQKYLTDENLFEIRGDNVAFIRPPRLVYTEMDSNKARIKLLGVNYPLIWSNYRTSPPNSFDGSSFKRNNVEESEEAVLKGRFKSLVQQVK